MGGGVSMGKKSKRKASAQRAVAPNLGWGVVGTDAGEYAASMVDRGATLPRTDYGLGVAFLVSVWAFRCVSVRARMIGATPWRIIDTRTNEPACDSTEYAPEHPVARAIQRVRMTQDAGLFELWEYSLCIWGETYLEKVRTAPPLEYPAGLRWLNPVDVSPVDISGYLQSIIYRGAGGYTVTLNRDEFILSRMFNPLDRTRGTSPMEVALQSITIDANAKAFIRANYRNFSHIPLIIRPKEGQLELSQDEVNQLARTISEKWMGVQNVGRVQVLGTPLDVTSINPTKLDDQLHTSDSLVRDICSAFGVPRSLAGDTDSAQYKANDDVLEWFYRVTLKPDLDIIEETMNLVVLPFFDETGVYRFEFDHGQYEFVTDADRVKQELLAQRLATTAMTLYDYQKASGVEQPPLAFKDLWKVEGFSGFVPTAELPSLWKYGVLGAPGMGMRTVPDPTPTPSQAPLTMALPDRAADVTNFPTQGDDQKISLRNSQYPQFDYAYAARLKDEHPDVWDAGGNERGNEAFEYWGKAREGDDSDGVLSWIREREAWAARHSDNFQLAGVIAQIKWGVIGSRGEDHMKEVVREEIDRLAARAVVTEFERFVKFTRNGTHTQRAFQWQQADDALVGLLTADLVTDDGAARQAGIERWRMTLNARAGVVPPRLPESVSVLVDTYRTACMDMLSSQIEHRRAHGLPDIDEETEQAVADAVRAFTLGVLSARAVQQERARFETEFFRLVRRAQLGRIDAGQLATDLFAFLTRFCYAVMVDGYEDGGVPDHALTDRDRAWLDEHLGEQRAYTVQFAAEIAATPEGEELSSRLINDRAKLWWNKSILPAYNEGLARAALDTMATFVQGRTVEKCRDCVQLNQRVYRFGEWFNYFGRKLVPCDATECGGWNCQCKIVPTPGKKRTPGRIPKLFGPKNRSVLQFEAGAEAQALAFMQVMGSEG